MTVVKAKGLRMQNVRNDEKDENEKNEKESQSERQTQETDIETVGIDELVFKLPDSVQKLQDLALIVNNFSGDIPIKI